MRLKNIVTISALIIALVFFCFSVNISLDVKELLAKHSLLNSKLVTHSSLAERLKMEKVSKSQEDDHLDDNIDDIIKAAFNDKLIEFKLKNMTKDSILLTIENGQFIDFIDVFFALTQNENIEINNFNIKFSEDGNYINCDMFLRKKS